MTNLWEEHSIFPMFWLEEFAELDSKYKLKLDGMLKRPMRAIHAAQWIVVSSVNYIYLDNFIFFEI